MGKETPRKRSRDYTRTEMDALLEFVASRKLELFGTGGKRSSKEEKVKERTWKRAAHALRAAGGQERNWQTIRKTWRDMASKAKAYAAPRTGGGPPPERNQVHDRVLAILAKEVVDGILPEEDELNSQDSVASDISQDASDQDRAQPEFVAPAASGVPVSIAAPVSSFNTTSRAPVSGLRAPVISSRAPISTQYLGYNSRPSHVPNSSEAQRPAQIRQLEIQEELLRIQQAKLNVKQQQVKISQSILEELKKLNKTLLANQPTVMDLLLSTQQS